MTIVNTGDVKLGSFLLDTLTVGMYEDPFHCIREYVQNGFDAINDAVAAGQLDAGMGRIVVNVTKSAKSVNLKISDNGTGVPGNAVLDRLVSIGISSKSPRQHAGFRGIGRLAGIAYCSELRFKTTVLGENFATVVSFDCPMARDLMTSGAQPLPLQEIIVQCVSISHEAARTGDHFTNVELINLTGLGVEFADPTKLEEYLSQYCPVDFSAAFKHKDEVERSAREVNATIPFVQVELKIRRESADIRKPYLDSVKASGKVSLLQSVEAVNNLEHGWFGWFGVTDFLGEINEQKVAGIRFRQRNIQVGDATLMEQIAAGMDGPSNRRMMKWVIGEVYVVNPKVIPNARRDGFEDNQAWRTIRKDMEKVVTTIAKIVRGSSTRRNQIKKFDKAVDNARKKISDAGGTIQRTMREDIDADLDKQLKLISKKLDKGFDPDRAADLISKIKELREHLKSIKEARALPGPTITKALEIIERILVAELKAQQAKKIFTAIQKELLALDEK